MQSKYAYGENALMATPLDGHLSSGAKIFMFTICPWFIMYIHLFFGQIVKNVKGLAEPRTSPSLPPTHEVRRRLCFRRRVSPPLCQQRDQSLVPGPFPACGLMSLPEGYHSL